MTNFTNIITVISISIILSGCAMTKFATQSGKPEIVVTTTDKTKIKSIVINELSYTGWVLVNDSDYSMTFSKSMEGFGAVMYQSMLGNSHSSTPQWVIRINIITINNSTRIVGYIYAKMQNAFGREDINDMTHGKAGNQLYQILQNIKYKL